MYKTCCCVSCSVCFEELEPVTCRLRCIKLNSQVKRATVINCQIDSNIAGEKYGKNKNWGTSIHHLNKLFRNTAQQSKVQSKSKYFDYDCAPTKTNFGTLTRLKSIEVAYLRPTGLYIVQRDESFFMCVTFFVA